MVSVTTSAQSPVIVVALSGQRVKAQLHCGIERKSKMTLDLNEITPDPQGACHLDIIITKARCEVRALGYYQTTKEPHAIARARGIGRELRN